MEFIVNKLKESYPDVAILEEIITEMNAKVEAIAQQKEDKRYTPALLLLGLICKYQQLVEDDLYVDAQTLDGDLKDQVEYLCALYWHHIHTTGVIIRIAISGADPELIPDMTEANRQALAIKLGIEEEDVVMTWVSEMEGCGAPEEESGSKSVMGHTPDFAISVDRKRQCVVITILGTRITPRPNMHDILMDLCAHTVPFLDGVAHAGMAAGANNINQRSLDTVLETLADNPGYSILVIGYSLGAGLAQLYTMELMEGESAARIPEGIKIRCLAYGAPPIFNCPENKRSYGNIITVENNTDGIIGASIKTVNDLFSKMVVIDQLDISKRTMTKMMFDDGTVLNDDNGEEENEDSESIKKLRSSLTQQTQIIQGSMTSGSLLGPLGALFNKFTSSVSPPSDTQGEWMKVAEALNNMPTTCEENLKLYNVGQHLLVMNNESDGSRSVKKFMDVEQTEKFTNDLLLRPGMFNDHMPWGYKALFGGDTWTPDESKDVSVDVFDQL